MNTKVLVLGACAIALMACNGQQAKKEAVISNNSTDDQKFAYMLGSQFGGQNFSMLPQQMGEYLDQDVVIQGFYDHIKSQKDSSFKLQMTEDSLNATGSKYSAIARSRIEATRPDSATMAAIDGDYQKIRSYMDSVSKTLPMSEEPIVKNEPVVLGDKPSDNQRFSYLIGLQFGSQFVNIGNQFKTDFDPDYFVLGVKDAAKKTRDTTHVMALLEDTLKAVGSRYNEKMKLLREEAMKKQEEEEKKLKEEVAHLKGDTLPNGYPVKMNFDVKMTGISMKAENLKEFSGKKALLMFYFSATCGHCAHAAPQILEISKEFASKGLTTIALASGGNNKSGIRKFVDNAKFDDSISILWDESRQFGELYSDGYVPKIYLVNPDGTYKLYAAFEREKDELKKEIAELLDGKNVEWKIEVPQPVDTLKPASSK